MTSSTTTVASVTHDRLRKLRRLLGHWGASDGRRFPWRESHDPYLRLLAEVLLQRTRADAVAAVWPVVVRRFPTPHHLASATEDEIGAVIGTLGLFRKRAAYLRAFGEALSRADAIPTDLDALTRLPGVGPYSAAAFLACGYARRTAPVDANVRRVLGRVVLGVDRADRRSAADLAGRLLASGDPAGTLYALLDFGSGPCTAASPACEVCPARRFCAYRTAAA